MSLMRKQIPLSRETPLSEVIVAKDAEQSDSQTSVNLVLTKTTMVMLTLTLACMTLVLGVMTVSLLHAYSKGYGTATAAYDALLPAMQHMNHTVANLDDASANARLVSQQTLHAASDGLPAANRLLIEGAELAHAMREIASKPTMNLSP